MEHSEENNNKDSLISHKTRIFIMGFALVGIFGILLLIGIIPRLIQGKEVAAETKPSIPIVYTTKPSFNRKVPSLDLPGEIRPYLVTSIYARLSGTLKGRYVDIGSKVSSGQLLSTIDVPDLDKELEQAKATLVQSQDIMKQAKYNYEFAQRTYQRWKSTGKGGALAQQDIEQHENDFHVAQAAFQAAQASVKNNVANVQRELALQSYKQIKAPFYGIISQRNVDPGANIVAGGSSTSTNLFTIQQMDKLRVFINVPQSFVPLIKQGMAANITIPEFPGQVFKGKVFSYSSMLDSSSRTMLTQIIVQNPSHKIYPGFYATISINMDKKRAIMTIPDKTIISTNKGLQTITVLPNHRLHYVPFKPGRDYGTEIEIQSGLNGNETLVENPTDSLKEGMLVKTSFSKSK